MVTFLPKTHNEFPKTQSITYICHELSCTDVRSVKKKKHPTF
jgi:hypothetical protein